MKATVQTIEAWRVSSGIFREVLQLCVKVVENKLR